MNPYIRLCEIMLDILGEIAAFPVFVISLATSAIGFSTSAFHQAALSAEAQSAALLIAFLAGVSEMLGQSVILVVNRVVLYRFLASIAFTGRLLRGHRAGLGGMRLCGGAADPCWLPWVRRHRCCHRCCGARLRPQNSRRFFHRPLFRRGFRQFARSLGHGACNFRVAHRLEPAAWGCCFLRRRRMVGFIRPAQFPRQSACETIGTFTGSCERVAAQPHAPSNH